MFSLGAITVSCWPLTAEEHFALSFTAVNKQRFAYKLTNSIIIIPPVVSLSSRATLSLR